MKIRLKTKTDYYVLIPIWVLFIFTFISILALGRYHTVYNGFSNALLFFIFFSFLPFGLTIGIIGDRILSNIELKKLQPEEVDKIKNKKEFNREDKIRLLILAITTFLTIPYYNALSGFFTIGFNLTIPLLGIECLKAQIWPFFPVHLGLNHAWLGYYLVVCAVLNSKIEKYFDHNAMSNLIVFGFCFLSLWGVGWMLNDFINEQIAPIIPGASFPFLTPSFRSLFSLAFLFQVMIVFGLAFLMYHFGWKKYYLPRIIKNG